MHHCLFCQKKVYLYYTLYFENLTNSRWTLWLEEDLLMRKTTPKKITKLEDDEVFVFGSNATGFHGAGSAGFAFKNSSSNNWRTCRFFQKALSSKVGSFDRVGMWAVLGVSRGFQKGRLGMSYAIETIKVAGQRRSTPLGEIRTQIEELIIFAKKLTYKTFLVTLIGSSLAGYSKEEMKELFKSVGDVPDNVVLPKEYEFRD